MLRAAGVFLAILVAAHTFARPACSQLPVLEEASPTQILTAVRSGGSTVTVVNFWATWCVPCREGFPALVRLRKDFEPAKVRVIFVSMDFPEAVPEARQFLAEHGVTSGSFLKSGSDASYVNAFARGWSGAMPATALFDADGTVVELWEGRTSYALLKERVNRVLTGTSPRPRTKEDKDR